MTMVLRRTRTRTRRKRSRIKRNTTGEEQGKERKKETESILNRGQLDLPAKLVIGTFPLLRLWIIAAI